MACGSLTLQNPYITFWFSKWLDSSCRPPAGERKQHTHGTKQESDPSAFQLMIHFIKLNLFSQPSGEILVTSQEQLTPKFNPRSMQPCPMEGRSRYPFVETKAARTKDKDANTHFLRLPASDYQSLLHRYTKPWNKKK